MKQIRVLMIGDIVGDPGRRVCAKLLPLMRKEKKIDFIVANGENIAGGSGITEKSLDELFQAGIDVVTSGDHIFKRKETAGILKKHTRLLRPANYPSASPGFGSQIYEVHEGVSLAIINLLGRVFLSPLDCPFQRITSLIEEIQKKTSLIIIDFHAEATSEKIALGWYLDGKVSAVFGTHTHVQTADETILPQGTAYITDIGMTGPFRSVLGRDIKAVLNRFLTQMPSHFEVASEDCRLNGALVDIDVKTGKAISIKRVQENVM